MNSHHAYKLLGVLLLAAMSAAPAAVAVNLVPPSVYTAQVSPKTDAEGDRVFTILGNVSPAATLRWQRKNASDAAFSDVAESSDFVGATTASLLVKNATATMNGAQFRCIVTDLGVQSVSSPATLSVGAPTVTIVGGDNQVGAVGEFNARPFDIAVWNAAGTEPLIDAPISFTVESGAGLLARSSDAGATETESLALRTDQDGTVQAYYRQPLVYGAASQIKAAAGTGQVTLNTWTYGFGDDPDGHSGAGAGSRRSRSFSGAGVGGLQLAAGAGSSKAKTSSGARSSALTERAMALGSRLVLKTPSSGFMTINRANWAISQATTP